MALSQIQCLKDNNVNWRINESKPEFFYSEDQRLALEALIQGGRDAFSDFIQAQNIRPFLSDLELERLVATAEVYSPGSENKGDGSEAAALSLQYWPERSEGSIPDLDMGWPDCISYRGVTRVSVYTQPPMEGQAHIKEVVRKTIAQAQKVIAVVMDLFTDMDIFIDLLDAGFRRKVAVYIVLEAIGLPHFLNMCRGAGMHKGHLKNLRVRCARGMEFHTRSARKVFGSLGQRFMFVDGDRAVSGSYSFTWTASRLDRNLITVVTGQAVETFDKQFQDLYLVSEGVSLSDIHLEEAPEPERVSIPVPVPSLSAAMARKLINPKYSLVTNNTGEANSKISLEKNSDNKNPVAKVLRPPREKLELPSVHPGLLNLERINMIPYLPTWPDPDPPSDVIGFINIRDSSKPMQVHLMRSELFETSQAIRFKDPFVPPVEPLPEKACPRPKSSKNLPSSPQLLKDSQDRPHERLNEAGREVQFLDHTRSSAKQPKVQPANLTQNLDQTCSSSVQKQEGKPPDQTFPVVSQELEQLQPKPKRSQDKPMSKEQPANKTHGQVSLYLESVHALSQEHLDEQQRGLQPSDQTHSPVTKDHENTQPQEEGLAKEEKVKTWKQRSHSDLIPGKEETKRPPVPKPRTIYLIFSSSNDKDSSEVSIVKELDKEFKTQPGLVDNSSSQASDPDTACTQDLVLSDALSSPIPQPGKGMKTEIGAQKCPDGDGQKNKQGLTMMEEDSWEELSYGDSSDISTTSEEFFECNDFDETDARIYFLDNGTCDGSGIKSKATQSRSEPHPAKKHQRKEAADDQQTTTEICSEIQIKLKRASQKSYNSGEKVCVPGRSQAKGTCIGAEVWRQMCTRTHTNKQDKYCRTAQRPGHIEQRRYHRDSPTGQLSYKRPPAVLWSRGGMTQVLLGSLRPGSPSRLARTPLIRSRSAKPSAQQRATRKPPTVQGDTLSSLGVPLVKLSNFRDLRTNTTTLSQQEQCL
ncbi:protein FAM83G [Arapaima gigas]